MADIPCIKQFCGHLISHLTERCELIGKLPDSAGALLYEEPCRFWVLLERAAARYHGQGSYSGRHEEAIGQVVLRLVENPIDLKKPTYLDLKHYLIAMVRNACITAYRCEHCWHYSRRHCDALNIAVSPKETKRSCRGEKFAFARESHFPLRANPEDPNLLKPDETILKKECIDFLEKFDPEGAQILRMLVELRPKEEILRRCGGKDPSWLAKRIHGRTDKVSGRRLFTPGIRQKIQALSAGVLSLPVNGRDIPPMELQMIQRWSKRWEAAATEFYQQALSLCLEVDYQANSLSLGERIKRDRERAEFLLDLYEAGSSVLYGVLE
jgi:hypothetical protein